MNKEIELEVNGSLKVLKDYELSVINLIIEGNNFYQKVQMTSKNARNLAYKLLIMADRIEKNDVSRGRDFKHGK